MVALLLVGLVGILIVGFVLWRLTYWQRHGIKGPLGFPLVGNMGEFFFGIKHYGAIYESIYNAHPELPYVGIYRLFNEPTVLLRSQDLIKEVMIRSFQHFQDNVLWVDKKRDAMIHNNPFVARGEQWKHRRTEIMTVFTPNKVKMSFPHINTSCSKLKEYVKDNLYVNHFDAKELCSKFTIAVVASAAYGIDAQTFTPQGSDITRLVENLFLPNPRSLLDTTALLFSPFIGHLIKYYYVPPKVQKWLATVIGSVLDSRLDDSSPGGDSPKPMDFVQWLIEARKKANQPVDKATIVGHCGTFLLEGFETSSSLMAFALYAFAINRGVQERVLNEIDEVMSRYNNEICYEALQEMVYFEASLYETLRVYPAMSALLKICTKPFELPAQTPGQKSFRVPKGMVFVVPVKAIHNDPDIYPDPLKFDPERFMATSDKQRLGCTFLGFGEGPRMCPGMRFALAQSKAGLVALLSAFSVSLALNTQEPLKISPTTFLTAAHDGIWIRFDGRK